ncbi:MAG: IS91 family transposase, partial [Thiothrix sp.]|nr:IS91 family transposase [Thiothrix sp.]
MFRLAQAVARFQDQLPPLLPRQHKVCQQILACRTAALGGFQLQCDACGQEQPLYHACRNRHCPRCQQQASEQWQQRELANVVDAPYFHLVFTLPHELNGWARLHPRVIYQALFHSVWATLNTLGHDPKRLDGQLGMTAVLHTWGQNLSQHVHLHCLIPGGALADNGEWHPAKSSYLFPIRVLSRLFRGRMVSALREAADHGELSRVTQAGEVDRLLNTLMQTDWVVYAKPCLHQAETVVQYLARYTRKIALSESRLLDITAETVSFRYQDYRDDQRKVMTLTGPEFLRCFLQHVLPDGFMRIRHFGWLANACRGSRLPQVRQAIAEQKGQQATAANQGEAEPASG